MNKLTVCRVKALLLLTCFVVLGSSCVNEKYDMSGDNLNLEVTPFQEGVVFPLGSLKPIKLGELLPENDFLKPDSETGGYAVQIDSTFDFNEQLSELQTMVKIPALDFSQSISFNFANVDVSSIEIKRQEIGEDMGMNIADEFGGSIPDIQMPTFTPTQAEVTAGLGGLIPNSDDMKLSMSSVGLHHEFLNLGTLPAALLAITEPIELTTLLENPLLGGKTLNTTVNVTGSHMDLNIPLPAGINDVKKVRFYNDPVNPENSSAIKISLSLKNDILLDGSLEPDININLGEVFILKDNPNGVVNLADGLTLSNDNNYQAETTIYIEGLALNDTELTDKAGGGKNLHKGVDVAATGTIALKGLTTTTAMLNNKTLGVDLDIDFVNLEVDDVQIEMDPVVPAPGNKSIPLNLDFEIPDGISGIGEIKFVESDDKTKASGIDLVLDAPGLENLDGLNAKLVFNIKFPKELTVPEAEELDNDYNILTIVHDLTDGALNKHIDVTDIQLPDIEEGWIRLHKDITVDYEATVDGIISTAALQNLVEAQGDLKVDVHVQPRLELADYSVEISGLGYDIIYPEQKPGVESTEPMINVELPAGFPDLEQVVIYPEKTEKGRNPEISIDLGIPEIDGLVIAPSAEDLVFSFPEMLVFETPLNLPAGCNYVEAENKLVFEGGKAIPSSITLPIEKLVITPIVEGDKKFVRGDVKVAGRIEVKGNLDKEAVDDFANPLDKTKYDVSFSAVIPDIKPSTVDLDKFESVIEKKEMEFEILKPDQMPKELAYLGEVSLNETYITLEVDGSGTDGQGGLPDLGAGTKLSVTVGVDLPEFIRFDGGQSGKLTRTGVLDPETKKIEIDPIKVDGLVLNLSNEELAKGLKSSIAVEGTILLENASLAIDDWLGKELNVDLVAVMKSIRPADGGNNGTAEEDGIDIATVSGKVAYEIAPDPINIEIGDLTSGIGDNLTSAKLDFNHVHLALNIATNLCVPVEADVKITPYTKDVAGEPIERTIRLNTEIAPGETVAYTKYWLANNEKGMPGDYTYENLPILDFFKDLKNMPEKFVVELMAKTLDQTTVLDMTTPYTLEAEYEFALPLEFGSEFEIQYSQVMENLPEILGAVLATGNQVALMGKIENSLPLALDLQFYFLDADGNRVPAPEDCGKMHIKACDKDGNPVPTDMNVVVGVNKGVAAEDIVSLELVFTASTDDTVVGVPVSTNSSLAVPAIQVALPKGVTVDLKDLMNNNEQ